MAYIYSNNGLSWRWRDKSDNTALVAGESSFDHQLSEAELIANFSNYGSTKNAKKYALDASLALEKSDVTIIRCAENGVSVPAAWAAYRATLRSIASGSVSGPVPTAPAYPAGT